MAKKPPLTAAAHIYCWSDTEAPKSNMFVVNDGGLSRWISEKVDLLLVLGFSLPSCLFSGEIDTTAKRGDRVISLREKIGYDHLRALLS